MKNHMDDYVLWQTFRVAGYFYNKSPTLVEIIQKQLAAGPNRPVDLVLKRDPSNRYDGKAVQVLDADSALLLGWIPKEENRQLALLMDVGNFEVYGKLVPISKRFSEDTSHINVDVFLKRKTAQTPALDDLIRQVKLDPNGKVSSSVTHVSGNVDGYGKVPPPKWASAPTAPSTNTSIDTKNDAMKNIVSHMSSLFKPAELDI